MTDQPEIDFLVLADQAEVQNGKLHLSGGCWDQLAVADLGQPVPIVVALSLLLSPASPARNITLTLRMEKADGTPVGEPLPTTVQLPATPISVPGHRPRASFAGRVAWTFPAPGAYRVTATITGTPGRRDAPFLVTRLDPAAAKGIYSMPTIPDPPNPAPTTMH